MPLIQVQLFLCMKIRLPSWPLFSNTLNFLQRCSNNLFDGIHPHLFRVNVVFFPQIWQLHFFPLLYHLVMVHIQGTKFLLTEKSRSLFGLGLPDKSFLFIHGILTIQIQILNLKVSNSFSYSVSGSSFHNCTLLLERSFFNYSHLSEHFPFVILPKFVIAFLLRLISMLSSMQFLYSWGQEN